MFSISFLSGKIYFDSSLVMRELEPTCRVVNLSRARAEQLDSVYKLLRARRALFSASIADTHPEQLDKLFLYIERLSRQLPFVPPLPRAEAPGRDSVREALETYIGFVEELLFARDVIAPMLDALSGKGSPTAKLRAYLSSSGKTTEELFGALPSHTVSILSAEGKEVLCEKYTVKGLRVLMLLELSRGLLAGSMPAKCGCCGRFFVSNGAVFCSEKNEDGRSCREIGARKRFEDKVRNDPAWISYRRAYKARYAQLMKGKLTRDSFTAWCAQAKSARDMALKAQITPEQLEERLNGVK